MISEQEDLISETIRLIWTMIFRFLLIPIMNTSTLMQTLSTAPCMSVNAAIFRQSHGATALAK